MRYFLIALPALAALWVFLLLPRRPSHRQSAPFTGRTFAHRGLYERSQCVPENSLEAFSRAADAGYGVELDVQLTRDGELVVFHDEQLLRACGVPGTVRGLTFEQVRTLRLFGTEHGIPTLAEALEALGGRVPVIVELKPFGDIETLCARAYGKLRAYGGAYCIECFHPLPVRWFKKHAPDVLRGQLSEAYRYSHGALSAPLSFIMSRTLSNVLARPHFIAYRNGPKCLSVRLCERLGAMRVCWTVRPDDNYARIAKQSDAVIFEHFRPDTRL